MKESVQDKKYIFSKDCVIIFFVGVIFTLISFLLDLYVVVFMSLIQSAFFIDFFRILTLIGDIGFFIPISIIISIFFLARNKRVSGLWLSVISVGIIVFITKLIINRPRPYESHDIVAMINTSMSSFPSGHAMIVFAAVPFLEKNFSNYKYYFFATAILVAFSRIYLNVHYLSDIVAGAFIGYIIGKIFSKLEDRLA